MKYRELIQFDPIVTVIELKSADDRDKARQLVKSYVMSDEMANMTNAKILSQLRLDDVTDNKGVFLVGNYGTGKSHLMSVISAVAQDAALAGDLQNDKFREHIADISGKFEVLRLEFGATTASLRSIITRNIESDLQKRGIAFAFPDMSTITNNKYAFEEMLAAFAQKYGYEKGYLIVIDELLDYLKSRRDTDLMLDIAFLRELGEVIQTSRLRIICGIQEALFENPYFSNVSKTLLKMKDRFEQALIRREDISYVVAQRILHKTPAQKAMIRKHLEPFCALYRNMAERMDEFVEMFPIHPAYVETFQRVYIAEKREVLKTISTTIAAIIDTVVPPDQPGIKSYDTYWRRIKEDAGKRVEPEIAEVLHKSGVLEDIINRSFTERAIYKPLATQIIYALSVHRLTTASLDAKLGLTVQNLKDDLCLFISMPVMDEEFLLSTVTSIMKGIMDTVSGQFIEFNKDNGQYYLDLKKDIDYDKKIEDKAKFLGDDALNRYYFAIMYNALEWDAPEYRSGHRIYQYNISWAEKNVYRPGYLFMGEVCERSTTEPPQDFYAYFLPAFGSPQRDHEQKADEVYFTFKGSSDFTSLLKSYAGAREMALTSAQGETRNAYEKRAQGYAKDLRRWLESNKTSCLTVSYLGHGRHMVDYLKGVRLNEVSFKDVIDTIVSRALNDYFIGEYPKYPLFLTRITERNSGDVLRAGLDTLAGKTTKLGTDILDTFGLLTNGKVKPDNSEFGAHFIKLVSALQPGSVLNASDIMQPAKDGILQVDNYYRLDQPWVVLVLSALVHSGDIVLLAQNNVRYDAGNLDALAKASLMDLYNFKRIEKPKSPALGSLRRLFSMLNLPEGLIVNPNTWEEATRSLLEATSKLGAEALHALNLLNEQVVLWGELLIPGNIMEQYRVRLRTLSKLHNDCNSRFNSPAKLKNFDYDDGMLTQVENSISILNTVQLIADFHSRCLPLTTYLEKAELIVEDVPLRARFEQQKARLLDLREQLRQPDYDETATNDFIDTLGALKKAYICHYLSIHARFRLDIDGGRRKGDIMSGPVIAKLNRLKGINGILSLGQYDDLVNTHLGALQVCYECTAAELQLTHICPKCHYVPSDKDKPVHGRLRFVEDRLDELLESWTKTIISAVDDPIIRDTRALLEPAQQKAIQTLVQTKQLPQTVDRVFIDAVNTLLAGIDSVEVDATDVIRAMQAWGPLSPADFERQLQQYIAKQLVGRDNGKARIIVKATTWS